MITLDEVKYAEWKARSFERLWTDIAPFEKVIEDSEHIPSKAMDILKEMGFYGLLVPEQHGGLGLSHGQYFPVMAELAKIHGGIRAVIHVHNGNAYGISKLASPEVRDALLPRCATGEASVAMGLTEPGFGTGADVGTTADKRGEGWVLNGRKWLITNSDFATHFVIFAKTSPGRSESDVSAFLIERGTKGFSSRPLPETMGCKGGEHGVLELEDVQVPASSILGNVGEGLAQMEETIEISRVMVAASSLGTAERSLELAVAHAKQRVTFGRPIAERQAVQRYIAEMAMDIQALRLMIEDCAGKWDRGQRIPMEASLCKQFGLEAVGRVTDRALLVFGGIGYTREHSIERLYRDARLNWLEEGTPTIQYAVAARELLKSGGLV